MKTTYIRSIAAAILLMAAMGAWAQTETGWRLGVKGGWAYNSLTIDTQYAYDLRYKGASGWNAGIWGQYLFKEWIGVRADLEWLSRGHKLSRAQEDVKSLRMNQRDGYLTLPITATFRVGGGKWHGYANLGGFVGYWATSYADGHDISLSQPGTNDFLMADISGKRSLDSRRDNRFDAGLVGGIGVEYEFANGWILGVEGRYYYSLTSRTKDYMQHFYNPVYNNTFTLGLTLSHRLPW